MSYTKTKIYQLALNAMLLSRELTNVETDTSNEVRALNVNYDTALFSTLQDLDLDTLSVKIPLELIEILTGDLHWNYVYKYPINCAVFRRIETAALTDTVRSHISKRVRIHSNGVKAIFTNEPAAIAEYIPKNVSLEYFSASAAKALALNLAYMTTPLLVGKGSKSLRESIKGEYVVAKLEAQELDKIENFIFEDDSVRSEFVETRIS